MLNRNFIKEIILLLISLLLFLSIPPFFVWKVSELLRLIIPVFIVILSYIYCRALSRKNLLFSITLAILYLFFALRDGKNVIGIIATISIVFIFAFDSRFIFLTYKKFVNIYCLFLIPSICVYIAVVLLGVELPYQIIDPQNSLKDYLYRQYPLLITSDTLSNDTFRFCSYFDEPGVVGTISGILLLIDGLNPRKWQTWILLISGVFSLSFAFFLLLFSNIILFQSTDLKILFCSLLIILFVIFANNEVLQLLLFDRFQIEDGQVAGINRTTSSMDFFMHSFWNSDKLCWGYGNNYAQIFVNTGGASFKDLLINYGLIGFGGLCVLSIYFGLRYLRITKRFLVFCIIWGCLIYQRPFIFLLIYFYLMYIILFVSNNQKIL